MIDIYSHPVFRNVNSIKKRGHLLRLYIAQKYASFYPRSKFVGITGSVGKTTTALAAKAILSEKGLIISTTDTRQSNPNLDPIFNIPMTLLRMTPKVKKVILEMGIEYPGEMDFYLKLVKPATVVVTRIFYQHSEYLGDISAIAIEKGKLVEQLPKNGLAILNWDDYLVRGLAEKTEARVIYFGTDPKNCHIWAGNIKISNMMTIFEINYGVERVEVRSNLLGKHQIYPLLAAAALGVSEGIPLMRIKLALDKIKALDHRMQALEGYNNSVVIDDTYNAAPIAMEEAIETLKYIPARRRIVVLGEMRELGDYSEKMHRLIAEKIFKDKIDMVLLGTGETKYIYDELVKLGYVKERIHFDLSNPQMVNKLLKILTKGDLILVKGAHGVRLDEVVKRINKSKKEPN